MKNVRMTIWLAVVAIIAGAQTCMASADSFEPDNSYSNAASITTDGQAQSHSIDPAADEDWLIFTLETRSDVVIETSGISGDTVMWLYNAQVGELSYDDDGGAGSFSRIQMSLPTGTYYVRIKEYNDKALISEYFVSVLATPIEVLSVNPNSATQGESVEVTIKGLGTTFFQGSSTITSVRLSKGSTTIDANSFTGIDATTLEASFDIPVNALAGKWNVHVSNSVDGNLPSFADGFMIYAYPDLNGDGKVDVVDFALLAKHWLEVAVPNVMGMPQSEAQAAIVAASLVVGTITQDYGAIPSGNVISSEPVAGTKVNAGSAVNLLISMGLLAIVPNVTGMTQAEAEAAIAAAGLVVGTLTEEYSETVVAGHIISQNPSSGEEVLQGSTVNLVVSKSSVVWVSINEPNFTGEMGKYETTNAQYCQYLNDANAASLITVYNNTVYATSDTSHSLPYFSTAEDSSSYSQITYSSGTFNVRSRDGHSMADHPVLMVSWHGATAFCNYYGYRLPTEWEWQAVADFNGTYTYGCGTSINSDKANYGLNNPLSLTSSPYTSPVGYYPAYGYGMCDMAGNVWEWTSSMYNSSERVIRGSCWSDNGSGCTVSVREGFNPSLTSNSIGFRVCR